VARILFPIGLILAFTLSAQAQTEYPRVEIFGGYSYASIERGGSVPRESAHGWAANASVNFHKYFGATADFAGQFGHTSVFPVCIDIFPPPPGCVERRAGLSTNQFLFGPRVTARTERVTGFGHVLFGASRMRVSSTTVAGLTLPAETETHFALGLGGGLDINAGRRFAIRVVQFDYIPVRRDRFSVRSWLDNVRVQAGVVIKLGGAERSSSAPGPSVRSQHYPRVEVFGGYSFMRVDGATFPTPEAAHGWATSASVNFHRYFGATAEIAGQYGDVEPQVFPEPIICLFVFPPHISCLGVARNFSNYQVLFGPRITGRTNRLTGFGHVLFGWNHIRGSGFDVGGFNQTRTDLAMALGGGLDVNIGRRLAIRVAQVDYVPVQTEIFSLRSFWLDNVRVQSGVVIKLGGR